MNRFEQLIEYVINDEEQKAQALFHEIVVEKSRQIYENLMTEEAKEEELDEAKHEEEEEELDESKHEEEEEEELDESKHEEEEEELDEAKHEEEVEEGAMGGDAADDLIDEVEMDEESDINMEGDGEEESEEESEEDFEMGAEGGSGEPATKDDIMNLEDKLDELMAEFEQLMGSDDMGDGDDMGADEGGDAIATDDTDEMMPMAEAVSLKAAPKPTTSEEGGVNKKSVVKSNTGAAGMQGSPVKTNTTDEKGRKAPDAKDMITDFQNKAGSEMKAQKAAPKPVTAQASGVNTRTPFPKG